MAEDHEPLILTAAFDAISAERFQRLRDRYFPARLNIVPAHLTLFHHLPGGEQAAVIDLLRQDGGITLPFSTGALRFLGRGVAIEVICPALAALRQRFAAQWTDWLTAQDRQGFRAHVTIQNKVAPQEARATMDSLAGSLEGLPGTIVGLDLWWYRGGPWELAHTIRWRPDD